MQVIFLKIKIIIIICIYLKNSLLITEEYSKEINI